MNAFNEWGDLLATYGTAREVPNDDLYHYVTDSVVFENLVNQLSLGEEGKKIIRESALGQEVRRRTKQDLFWAARYFTWGTNAEGHGRPISECKVLERVHGPICEMFVHKDDSKTIAQQDWKKERILLHPRGGLKSTIDCVDVFQWILNFPQIRILFLTAADDLAVGFVDALKGHFILRDHDPSLANVFFPDYCLSESQLGTADAFICPLWAVRQIKRVEPTVLSGSVTSTLSGYHFDVIKADDTVSNRNSENSEQCAKVIKNFAINRKMLMPYGYIDKIGTRYADEDLYGDALEKVNVGDVKKQSGPLGYPHPLWEKIDNLTSGVQILINRGIVIKPEAVEKLKREGRPITYREAGEEGCYLLFPEHQPFNWLMKEFDDNERAFEGQINQNPHISHDEVFPLELLLRSTVPFHEIPVEGPCTQFWDFAFSARKSRDYCTSSNILWSKQGHAYVNDLVRQKFSPDALAQAVVDFAVKWRPYVVGIENAGGSQFLENDIIRKAQATGIPEVIAVCSRIDWVKVDTQEDAKRTRIRTVQPWLVNGMMKFANYIPFKEVLYTEFQRCMALRRAHNDIPDCIAQQLRYAPRSLALVQDIEANGGWSRDDASYNLMYGQWLSDSDSGADAFGRIGQGMPGPVLTPQIQEDDGGLEDETPYPESDNVLGSGLFG